MEAPHQREIERDDIEAAVLRERELNEALSSLDRAISQFASSEAPSRWLTSHAVAHRQAFPTRQLSLFVHRCVTAFRPGRRVAGGFNTLPFS
jgi:hypothetical protein